MKRKLIFVVAIVLMSTTTFAQFSGSGSGTQSDPYLITNAMQLDQVRNFLGNSNVYFKMMADIDLQEFIEDNYPTQGWLPIGNSSSTFKGNFDGNGKTISNLVINRPSLDYVGLFGKVESSLRSISNLIVEGDITGRHYTGGIIGHNSDHTISNVCFKGKIIGQNCVGGIIGYLSGGNLNDGSSYPYIIGNNYVGGFVGYSDNNATITSSFSIVEIQSTGDCCGGGVGCINATNELAKIATCFIYGRIIASEYVGGIVGKVYCNHNYAKVQDNYFHGKVTGNKAIGGICGASRSGEIIRNYSKAEILGSQNVGGILGIGEDYYNKVFQNIAINDFVRGNVYVGRIYGRISTNTVIGEIGTENTNKALNATIVSVDDVEQVCEDSEQHGQGVGKSLLKYKATYQGIGWDFADIWDMQETESYPYFKWQATPPGIDNTTSTATIVSGEGVNEATIHLIINGQSYQTTCSNNVWSVSINPLDAGDTIYAYATMTDKSASYYVTTIVEQAPITSLHMSDDVPSFAIGVYEGGIDYTRVLGNTDKYASFCFPFSVKQSENAMSIEELYVPLGIALKYSDANNEDVLKVLFVATDEVEAGTPFIAKLADAHSANLSIVSATNEITQGVEASSTNIIPYIYDASAVGSNAAIPTNGNISWCGTFEGLSNQTFYALQADGGFIYQLNANTNPFRGYLSVTNMPTIKKVIAFVDAQGDATSIEHMFGQDSYAPQKIFCNGQIYILMPNGQKYSIIGNQIK